MRRTIPLALILLSACSGPDSVPEAEPQTRELTGSRLLARDELRGQLALSALEVEDHVYLGVAGADSLVAVYDTSGHVVRHYGPEGDGPGELRGPVFLRESDDAIWIWDSSASRVSLLRPGAEPPLEVVWTIPGGAGYPHAYPLDDGALLSGAWPAEVLFAVWMPGMTAPEPRGALPPLAAAHWDVPWGMIPTATAVSPDGERIAALFSHTGEVEIARVADGSVLASTRTGDHAVEIDTERFVLLSPAAYVMAAATPDRIYASWSGEVFDRTAPSPLDVREVHVFDWDGVLRERLVLDAPGVVIGAGPDHLFTSWMEPLPEVRMWDLRESDAAD